MPVLDAYLGRLGLVRFVLVAVGMSVAAALIEGTQPGAGAVPLWAPLLRAPLFFVELAPLIMVASTAWTIESLRERGELSAFRTAGAGLMRIGRTPLLVGLFAGLAVTSIGEWVLPQSERLLMRIGYERPGLPVAPAVAAIREGDRVIFADGTTFRWLDSGALVRLPRSAPLPQPSFRPETASLVELAAHDTPWARTIFFARAAQPLACVVGAILGLAVGWRLTRHATLAALGIAVLWGGCSVLLFSLASAGAIAPIAAGIASTSWGLLLAAGLLVRSR